MAPFCSCPASLVSRTCFAVGPGCAKCFFLLRSVGRRDLSAGPEQNKKTSPRVFFLLRPRGKAGEGEAPLGAGTGPEQKKKHHAGCFFCSSPAVGVLFFLLWPRADAHSLTAGLGGDASARRGHTKKKNTPGGVFFLLRPRRVFLDNSKKCLGYYIGSKRARRGHSKKKTPLPRASGVYKNKAVMGHGEGTSKNEGLGYRQTPISRK